MDIVKIVSIGIISAIAIMLVKQIKPEFAIMLTIAALVVMLFLIIDLIKPIINFITDFTSSAGISSDLLFCIFKIIGIGYITEFGAGICQDSGCSSIADKVQIAGKCVILVVSLPIISQLFNIVSGLLPWRRKYFLA